MWSHQLVSVCPRPSWFENRVPRPGSPLSPVHSSFCPLSFSPGAGATIMPFLEMGKSRTRDVHLSPGSPMQEPRLPPYPAGLASLSICQKHHLGRPGPAPTPGLTERQEPPTPAPFLASRLQSCRSGSRVRIGSCRARREVPPSPHPSRRVSADSSPAVSMDPTPNLQLFSSLSSEPY